MGWEMGNKNFKRSAMLNNATYTQYINRFTNITVSSIGWNGLPDEIDERYLELWLFYNGKVLFFNDDVLNNFIVARFTGSSPFTIYNEPMFRHAYTNNGINWDLDNNNSVIIYDNFTNTSMYYEASLFAERLYTIERTIDVNIAQQKTPRIIIADENELMSLQNAMMAIDGNQYAIYASKKFNIDNFNVLPTQSPYVSDKLYTIKRQYINEYLTMIGIATANSEKAERLVSDEAATNISPALAYRNIRLARRRQAGEQIGRMFGIAAPTPYFRYPDIYNSSSLIPYEGGEIE